MLPTKFVFTSAFAIVCRIIADVVRYQFTRIFMDTTCSLSAAAGNQSQNLYMRRFWYGAIAFRRRCRRYDAIADR